MKKQLTSSEIEYSGSRETRREPFWDKMKVKGAGNLFTYNNLEGASRLSARRFPS
jgi:hypothetical protein